MPWLWNTAVTGPIGAWIIDFMECLHRRPSLHYTMSGWWSGADPTDHTPVPPLLRQPATLREGAEMWMVLLTDWKRRFGFERLLYVDIANEMPFFFPGLQEGLKKDTGADWGGAVLAPAASEWIAKEINGALGMLWREFPELRFTVSTHGDLSWLDVPVELDCLDVHFYADADPRWTQRTKFDEFQTVGSFFETDQTFGELSQRSTLTAKSMAPMLRARQRGKLMQFADWSRRRGMPLTTSEGWAAWYYIDHPQMDWKWLLEWAAWTVDDAIAAKMWGWTPHNYVQPQFATWRDPAWHRRLNDRFLSS